MQTLSTAPDKPSVASSLARPPVAMFIALGIIAVAFVKPLMDVTQLALRSQVYSYIILMPFITGYLLFTNKQKWEFYRRPDLKVAVIPAVLGLCLLAGYFLGVQAGWAPHRDDYLALMILSFLCFACSIAAAYFTGPTLRAAAYPLAFLIFMAPFPLVVLHGLEAFLQHFSADVAHGMLVLSGMPLIRDGTSFQLPGFAMEVAPECSGIRSTLALFITSLVAGYVLLRSPWRRATLALVIIPLALLRNGFRIWTIAQLCVNVDPELIHSFIHKRGGPIFFALSLIPFSLLLFWLIRSERKNRPKPTAQTQ
jgi:exosortase C (VPDSG-CTERM-specific)